jgi:hypothetical protein
MTPGEFDSMNRRGALAEAMHLADIRGSHLQQDSLADQVVEDAKKFEAFLKGSSGLKAV